MILKRYALKEHLAPFGFAFSVIMFLLSVDLALQMMDLILGKGVAWTIVLELFVLNLAWMVALAVPMSVLVSTLMAFGRLSGSHEVMAMRALGIGVYQIVWPVVLAGGVLGCAMLLFNDRVLPDFNHRARLLLMDIHRKRPSVVFEGKAGIVIQEFQDYRILFGDIDAETGSLEDVIIYRYEPRSYPITIVAKRGELRFQKETDEVFLVLYNGEYHRVDEKDPDIYVKATFEKQIHRLGEAGRNLVRTITSYRNDREMTIDMMQERVDTFTGELMDLRSKTETQIQAFFQYQLFEMQTVGDVQEPDFRSVLSQFFANVRLGEHKQRAVDRLQVEIHKKYSISVACLAFIRLGAPPGILVRKSGPAVGAGCSVGFFLFWWLCLIGGEKLADRGVIEPWLAMWGPNLITVIISMFMNLQVAFEWHPWAKRRV